MPPDQPPAKIKILPSHELAWEWVLTAFESKGIDPFLTVARGVCYRLNLPDSAGDVFSKALIKTQHAFVSGLPWLGPMATGNLICKNISYVAKTHLTRENRYVTMPTDELERLVQEDVPATRVLPSEIMDLLQCLPLKQRRIVLKRFPIEPTPGPRAELTGNELILLRKALARLRRELGPDSKNPPL